MATPSAMIAPTMRHWVTAAALAALAALTRAVPADAADSSMWDGDARSAMRLVAGSAGSDRAALRAGVELRLGTGWKTYWRYPGDSGVPPRFDFSKSTNVKSVAVRWPAPHRFTDENGASIGYKSGVLLPLDIVPADPKQPVTLRLTLEYAVCEKLCIPATGSATLAVPAPSSFDRAVAAAAAHVPREAALGGSGPLAVRSVRHEPGTSRVVVEVAAPEGPPLDLFVEGPTEDWALPLPEPVAGAAPGTHRFSFELDGLPPGATAAGATLRFTLISGDNAIEVTTVLD
jgi:DsbC/DsbD-like thiol-disulfide interchange protein